MALRWRQGCLAAPSIMPLLLPAAFMLPLIAQVLGFARPEGDNKRESAGAETGAALQNGLGLMQWLIVAAFVLYFVSYAVDVHQCACQDEQDAETVRPLNPFLLSRSYATYVPSQYARNTHDYSTVHGSPRPSTSHVHYIILPISSRAGVNVSVCLPACCCIMHAGG
jgi:hypothetical protein